jgi:hypothetical protein
MVYAAGEQGTLPSRDLAIMRLSPRPLRYKLWAVIQLMLWDAATAHAIPFLPVPASTQTADGFLCEEYAADITHANDRYGVVVMDDIWQRFMKHELVAAG